MKTIEYKNLVCMHTASKCYNWNNDNPDAHGDPVGLLIHATGEGSKVLRRYVQPTYTDPNRAELLEELGKNRYGNHWNRSINKGVHYMIGKLADGDYAVAQMLPDDFAAWGVGKGINGSYNYIPTQYIQIEIQDGNDPNETYQIAVDWAAKICKKYGWTSDNITSHGEAYKAGYGSNHSDPKGYFSKINKDMDDFRDDVQEILDQPAPVIREKVEDEDIEVGKRYYWDDNKQYTNANQAESKAKSALPGVVTIKRIYRLGKSKHPFQVVRVKGKGSSANGFVDGGHFYKE